MTFEEIVKRAASELGISDELHSLAVAIAGNKADVPPDIFNGVPDEAAVKMVKILMMAELVEILEQSKNN